MLPRNQQPMIALNRANVIRRRRSEVKRAVKSGWIEAADLIREPPEELESMAIAPLLRAQPHWGRIKVRDFLSRFHVSESRQLGRLTKRQRQELSQALAARRNGK